MQQAGTAVHRVEDMEFGRRLAVERELELPGPDGIIPGRWSNAVWDETGAFLIYGSLLGIKGSPFLFGVASYALKRDSCERGDEQSFKVVGQGRIRPFFELYTLSRRPIEKDNTHSCMSFRLP